MIVVLAKKRKFKDLWVDNVEKMWTDFTGVQRDPHELMDHAITDLDEASERVRKGGGLHNDTSYRSWLMRYLYKMKKRNANYVWLDAWKDILRAHKLLIRHQILKEMKLLVGTENNIMEIPNLTALREVVEKDRENVGGYIRSRELKVNYVKGSVMVVRAKTKAAAQFLAKDTDLCIGWGHKLGKHPERTCRYDADYGPDKGNLYFILEHGKIKYSMMLRHGTKGRGKTKGRAIYVGSLADLDKLENFELRNPENRQPSIVSIVKKYKLGKLVAKLAARVRIKFGHPEKVTLAGKYSEIKLNMKGKVLQKAVIADNVHMQDSNMENVFLSDGNKGKSIKFVNCGLTRCHVNASKVVLEEGAVSGVFNAGRIEIDKTDIMGRELWQSSSLKASNNISMRDSQANANFETPTLNLFGSEVHASEVATTDFLILKDSGLVGEALLRPHSRERVVIQATGNRTGIDCKFGAVPVPHNGVEGAKNLISKLDVSATYSLVYLLINEGVGIGPAEKAAQLLAARGRCSEVQKFLLKSYTEFLERI